MASPRSQPNFLAGPYLDRAALIRKDELRLRAALEDPRTLFVPVWRTRNLVSKGGEQLDARLIEGIGQVGSHDPASAILLGKFRDRWVFAIELDAEAAPSFDSNTEFQDLRMLAGELPHEEAGLLAYARAMLLWRERHRFCGRCGSPTRALQGGHVLECTNASCAIHQFPRIDPAVIVLVVERERVLLGRQAAWPPGRYSTVAGFVEPGESLEDAVVREVREETGIEVAGIEYHSSQPWPFPSSLMLGFTAQAATTAIDLSDEELEDARWFTRAQIAAGECALPTSHSISFRLIEDWYDAGSAIPLRDEPQARRWSAPTAR